MKHLSFAAVLLIALGSWSAHAQATRTYVSGVGDDANPCSRTAPCKTFAGAISKTAAGGEINVIDQGGFGAVTITQSITIDGGGILAGVLVSGTNGINISAGASGVVTLRGLDFNGLGNSPNAVSITSAGTVHIEKCRMYGFTSSGISVTSASTALTVSETQIHDLGGSASGVSVTGTNDTALLETVRIANAPTGITAGDTTQVTTHNVDISSGQNGVVANGSAVVVLDGAVVANTTTAVTAVGATSLIGLNNSTFQGNTTVIGTGSGTVGSYGNNRMKPGNGSIGTISITYSTR